MEKPDYIIERGVTIPMRDGTKTVADIYRPNDDERHPVVLTRTVYTKEGVSDIAYAGPLSWIAAGYVYISQDVRGVYGSEGEVEFVFQERDDGYDSVEWAARQPWSTGKVGIIGASAIAMIAWQTASARPPSPAAGIMSVGTADMEGLSKKNGALSEYYFAVDYMLYFISMNVERLDVDDEERNELRAQVAELAALTPEDLKTLPLWDYPILRDRRVNAGLWDIYMSETTDDFWEKDALSPGKDPSRIDIPVMSVSGFFDPFTTSMTTAASNPDLGHKVIIGPWAHFGVYGAPYGTKSYRDAPGGAAWTSVSIDWFDRWLKDDAAPAEPGSSRVHYFVSGDNVWGDTPTWPPAGEERTLFLSADAGQTGGGALVPTPPTDGGVRGYTYDPTDPVPTLGGVIVSEFHEFARTSSELAPDGVQDQRPLEDRQDVLVYTSDELEEPLRFAGSVAMDLWVSSSAEDTDFFVRLIDVGPDGFAANVTEGFIRARNRNGGYDAWLTPGEAVKLELESDPAAHCFLPGHKVRVHVTSSSFPKYSRNLNSRAVPEFGGAEDIIVADQQILHGGSTASSITFNVIPEAGGSSPYASVNGPVGTKRKMA